DAVRAQGSGGQRHPLFVVLANEQVHHFAVIALPNLNDGRLPPLNHGIVTIERQPSRHIYLLLVEGAWPNRAVLPQHLPNVLPVSHFPWRPRQRRINHQKLNHKGHKGHKERKSLRPTIWVANTESHV